MKDLGRHTERFLNNNRINNNKITILEDFYIENTTVKDTTIGTGDGKWASTFKSVESYRLVIMNPLTRIEMVNSFKSFKGKVF